MSDKLDLLRYIDHKIYKHHVAQMNKVCSEAQQLNEGNNFKYLAFSTANYGYNPSPNQLTKDYLDEMLIELAPVMNERAIINAYLLRYTNAVIGFKYPTVVFLLPEQMFKEYRLDASRVLTEDVQETLELFKAMTEFNLIKKRLFLGAIYGS
jgi:hypothetical protein